MRRENIDDDLKEFAFEFFYWFSRFEFALKENGFCSVSSDNAAAPNWKDFKKNHRSSFTPSDQCKELIGLNPRRQTYRQGQGLFWEDVDLTRFDNELDKVVKLLKTVRNNLFHGGKHGAEGWDNPNRIKALLDCGKKVLDELAEMAGFSSDYDGYY